MVDSLGGRFITAEDVGTSGADIELIRRETPWALGVPVEDGGSGDPSPSTAHGLLAALRAVADHLWKDDHLHGRRVAVQGVGKVGGAFVELLVEAGCEVVVGDVNDEAVARAVETYGVKAVEPDEILSVPCDVFSPCAMGGVLDADSIPRLRCEAVVGSANNQLADDDDDMRLAGLGVLYAPDFVVNSGGLINVAEELGGYRPERAARRVQGVGDATRAILQARRNDGHDPAPRRHRGGRGEARLRRRAGALEEEGMTTTERDGVLPWLELGHNPSRPPGPRFVRGAAGRDVPVHAPCATDGRSDVGAQPSGQGALRRFLLGP